MKLYIQSYLEIHSVEQLKAELDIAAKPHPKYPELIHFSYGIESSKDSPIVQECRGIILNSQDNWAVVAFPFRRFANAGEEWAAPIDWSSVRCAEKVDGSLLFVWYYDGIWQCSTKGSPDAGGQVDDFGFTFAQLFWKTLKDRYATAVFNPGYTYMMELVSPYNRIVCQYGPDPSLTLIGVRDVASADLHELSPYDVEIGIPPVKEFPLGSLKEIVAAAEALDPVGQEGFVVVDKNFSRLKVKSPKYVLIHHLRDGLNCRRMIELIKIGEAEETLAYYPEFRPLYENINTAIKTLVLELEADYEAIRTVVVQKDFALKAVASRCSGALFALRKGQVKTIQEFVFEIQTEKLQKLIGMDRVSFDHLTSLEDVQ